MLHEPTMGLYLLREYLLKRGFKVDVLDGTYQKINDTDIFKKAQVSKVIGFYAVYTNMEKIFAMASFIKQKKQDSIIIVGGPNWPAGKEILINESSIDAVIKEEAEISIEKILLQLRINRYFIPETIKGIFFRSGKLVIDTGNNCGFHRSSKFTFVQFKVPIMKKSILKLITAKGCPNNCNFCPSSGWKELSNMKEAVSTIEAAWNEGIDTFYIADENFCPPKLSNRVILFCDLIKNSDVILHKINLKVFLEPNTPIKILKCLSKVAYINAFVGFESFCDKTLEFFGKKLSRKINLHFWNSAVKLGLNIIPGIIALHPFSTPKELLDLINILAIYDILSWRLLLKKLDLYPGTDLLKKMEVNFPNLLRNDFSSFIRPSSWNYEYDRHLNIPVMSIIEKSFTSLANKEEIQELYSMIQDLSLIIGSKKSTAKKMYQSIRSDFNKHTKELAQNIVQTISQGTINFEKEQNLSISQYLEEVKIILTKCRDFFPLVVEDGCKQKFTK